jgi:hypothetical protein
MVFSFWRSMAISRPILPINIFFTKLECSWFYSDNSDDSLF